MPHLSDLCHTTSKCHQSIFVQVVPDDAQPRPFQTIISLTVDHLASCKYAQQLELPHSDCIHHQLLTFSIACPSIFTLASFSSVFVFTTFICIPYHALSVCNLSTVSCSFSLLCSIISMSSANLRLSTRLPWTWTLHCFLYSWFYPLFSPGTKQMIVVTMDRLLVYINCHLKPFTQMSINWHCQLCLTVNCFYQYDQFLVHHIWLHNSPHAILNQMVFF